MNEIFIGVSICLTIISLLAALVVFWQYITGRPYWGEDDHSGIIPLCISMGIVPLVNILTLIIVIVMASAGAVLSLLYYVRERAVDRREIMMNRRNTDE